MSTALSAPAPSRNSTHYRPNHLPYRVSRRHCLSSRRKPCPQMILQPKSSPSLPRIPPTVVTVDTLSLQSALSKYVKVIANKTARRIVQGIRMIAAEERLDLFGTDLELSLHMTVPAEVVLTPCSAIVADYKALLKAVKAIRDRQTRLALYWEYLIVSDAGTSTHISSFGDVEYFPEPPRRLVLEDYIAQQETGAPEEQKQDAEKFEKTKEAWRKAAVLEFQEFAVVAEAMAAAFLYVMPGMSKGDTRYALNGVYMTGNGRGGAEFVASNTHVLYRHDAVLTAGTLADKAGFILLPKMADWLTKNVSGTLTVKTDPNTVFVEGCDFILIGRRIPSARRSTISTRCCTPPSMRRFRPPSPTRPRLCTPSKTLPVPPSPPPRPDAGAITPTGTIAKAAGASRAVVPGMAAAAIIPEAAQRRLR